MLLFDFLARNAESAFTHAGPKDRIETMGEIFMTDKHGMKEATVSGHKGHFGSKQTSLSLPRMHTGLGGDSTARSHWQRPTGLHVQKVFHRREGQTLSPGTEQMLQTLGEGEEVGWGSDPLAAVHTGPVTGQVSHFHEVFHRCGQSNGRLSPGKPVYLSPSR